MCRLLLVPLQDADEVGLLAHLARIQNRSETRKPMI